MRLLAQVLQGEQPLDGDRFGWTAFMRFGQFTHLDEGGSLLDLAEPGPFANLLRLGASSSRSEVEPEIS